MRVDTVIIKYPSDLNLCDIVLRRGQIATFQPQRRSLDVLYHRIPVWLSQSIKQASNWGSDESGIALYQLKRSLLTVMGGRRFLSLLAIIAWTARTGEARKLSSDPLCMGCDEI